MADDAAAARNDVLASLAQGDRSMLAPHVQEVQLEAGAQLREQGVYNQFVYFPHTALLSLITIMQEGDAVETAVIGSEGMLGAMSAYGHWPASSRAIVQFPGAAARISATHFAKAVRQSGTLQTVVLAHQQHMLAQVHQTAACNALHTTEQRLSRWLLQAHDYARGDCIPLTQEFLSEMLGVRRTTVTVVARTLQKEGLIAYRRGRIEVLDRTGLEHMACECYDVMRVQRDVFIRRLKERRRRA